jgi:transcriptional regulator with XRE-family HTH domain
MPRTPISLGSSVRTARQARKLTQLCLATRLGISSQYLSDIELGNRTPSCDRLLGNLAQELRLELDYLYYLAGLYPPGERGRYGAEEYRERLTLSPLNGVPL